MSQCRHRMVTAVPTPHPPPVTVPSGAILPPGRNAGALLPDGLAG